MTILLFSLLAFISEVLGVLVGFGSSIFFVPIATLFFDFQTTLLITGIFHVFSNIFQLFLFRKDIDWNLVLKIGIPSAIFVLLGAFLTNEVELKYINTMMGFFLIGFGVITLRKNKFQMKSSNSNLIIGGISSGFLTGLIGTGGAIRGAALATFNLPKATFVATSAAVDLAVDVGRTLIYLSKGYLTPQYYVYVPLVLVISILGSLFAKAILNRIPQEQFRKIVTYAILVIGIYTVYKSFI